MIKIKWLIGLLLVGIVFSGCGLFSPPLDDVRILNYKFDPDFEQNGIVTVKMIPLSAEGEYIEWVDDITAVASYSDQHETLDADLDEKVSASAFLPWAFGVDIDSSGSMSSTDPGRLRVSAAKLFTTNILAEKSSSEFNIYDFGNGYDSGFSYTRKLTKDWTSDQDDIDDAVDKVAATGGTPLYESVLEVLREVEDEKSSVFWQRALIVLSDGSPSSTSMRDDVYQYAVEKKIPVNTVSLGSGSYEKTMSELAEETGGIYTGAEDADSLSEAFEAISLGTSNGYLVYTLKFRDPSELPNGSLTPVSIRLTVIAKGVSKVCDLQLN